MTWGFNPNRITSLPLGHDQHAGFILVLLADDRVCLPMPEFLSVINVFGAFLNAASQFSFVLAHGFGFGITTRLFGQIHVFDRKYTEIDVVIQRLCANYLLAPESSAFKCRPEASVKRPFIVTLDMFNYILEKWAFFQ